MSAASLLERAFEPGKAAPSDPASERILDAAMELAAASGIRNLTMDEIARRAGVGRMTVYRRFGDRQRLVDALAGREVRRCLAELDAAIDPADTVEEQIADGFAASLRIAREHPLLERFSGREPEVLLEALTANGAAIFVLSRDFVADRLRSAQVSGLLGAVDVEAAAELLVRLAFSFALIGETALPLDDEERAREVARAMIAPMLASLPTAPAPGAGRPESARGSG